MKQNTLSPYFAFFTTVILFFLASFSTASAFINPTLNLSLVGNTTDSVKVDVTGDVNSSVILFYTPSNLAPQIKAIGTTNASGFLSTTISSSAYGLATNNPVHVSVGGINGVVSSTVLWPTVLAGTANPITLSQTGMVLSIGQTNTISAVNNTTGSLYLSNNSNASVASAAINGNQITFLALGYGSTAVTVCSVGYTTNCPIVYLTVQNSNTQTLTLSQSNVSLSYGQSAVVTISGGTGVYIVSNNSSSGNVSTSINGNTLVLGGNSSISGTSSLTVCSSDMSSCGVINVTLGGLNSNNVLFSQSAPTLSVGQSMTVSLYGNTSTTYSISSNSNASVVQATLSGTVLTLYGVSGGTAIINVCASSGGCSSVTATVSSSSSVNPVYLSQSSVTLAVGQTSSVSISGGTTPYILLTASNLIFQAGVSGNSLYLTGISAGSAQVTVCTSASTGCASLSLQVTGTQTNTSFSSSVGNSFLKFSSANPGLNLGQSTNITVLGGLGGSYTVAYNSNASTVQATISGSSLSLYGLRNGYVILVICDTQSNCGALPVMVGSTTTNTTTTTTYVNNGGLPSGCSSTYGYSTTTGAFCGQEMTTTTTTPRISTEKYQFTQFLKEGMSGTEILELQKKLTELGYYHGPQNGNFGPLTAAGVKELQRTHGVSAVGYVGPSTREALNTN